jgi:protein transport protein SEC20
MVEDTLDRRDAEEEANRTAAEEDEVEGVEEDRPNPMKRMWEEEVVVGQAEVRDEL